MRVAIVSTPRSGNMWLRRLLVAAYGLEELAAHRPRDVPWHELPERCVLQLHWRRTPELVDLLERHGFSVVTLARHPLDVLLSILHFAPREPQTQHWLDGEGGDESSLVGADPGSRAFRVYGTGPRARALLSVSVEWWDEADARVRYRDLVASPEDWLTMVAAALPEPPAVDVAAAVESVRFADLQREATNGHFWLGRPGLWRDVLPRRTVRAIAAAQPSIAALGWEVDRPRITRRAARDRWRDLDLPVVVG